MDPLPVYNFWEYLSLSDSTSASPHSLCFHIVIYELYTRHLSCCPKWLSKCFCIFPFKIEENKELTWDNGADANGEFSFYCRDTIVGAACGVARLGFVLWPAHLRPGTSTHTRTHTHWASQKSRVIIESLMNEQNAVREAWKRRGAGRRRVEISAAQSKLALPLLHKSGLQKAPKTMRDKWGLRFIKAPLKGCATGKREKENNLRKNGTGSGGAEHQRLQGKATSSVGHLIADRSAASSAKRRDFCNVAFI